MCSADELFRRLTVFTNLYGLEIWVRTLPEPDEDGMDLYIFRVNIPSVNEYREYVICPEIVTEEGIISLMDDILSNLLTVTTTS